MKSSQCKEKYKNIGHKNNKTSIDWLMVASVSKNECDYSHDKTMTAFKTSIMAVKSHNNKKD